MDKNNQGGLISIGIGILAGLILLGVFINSSVKTFKDYERTITVRGLAEQEHMADVVIWPLQFTLASNNREEIYSQLDENATIITSFLAENGINEDEISIDVPVVTDRQAQRWGGDGSAQFRYVASQAITVYSNNVEHVRSVMRNVGDLGRRGVIISGDDYQFRTEYMFTRLNDIKPEMIEAATIEARKVAEKFAEDSDSKLGKIKTASQGQFTISDRDNNNPHIKNVRVVSTIVYYLTD
ncbi:MAG: SIMPL domain-containing protein [Balneolaceae bacterium]|nr:MAG: SIMPL domain-containing protein [Balneolaceae bacterium]